MITIRTPHEIELLREAGRVVAKTHEYLAQFIKPGITTKQLDKLAEDFILSCGAKPSFKGYYGFPGSICASLNDMVIHGIPDDRVLKEGDVLKLDIGACKDGYHGDSAWTYKVGKVSKEAEYLMQVTHDALFAGLAQAKPGNRVGDISAAIEEFVASHGCTSPYDYTGHGVGTSVHEDPNVPNYGRKGKGPKLKVGMVIAIEPMVHLGKADVYVADDDWGVITQDHSLTAHYEHTIAITEDGYLILTAL